MNQVKKDFWILGISRGHNSGVCLLKNGKIVFAIEEERFSRKKYDGSPFGAMVKVKEYTDKVDYMFIAHTQDMTSAGKTDFTGDNVYVGLARKIGLIDQYADVSNHPQVIDLSHQHHKIHAACAFYRSGFDDAVAVIADGCGSVIDAEYVYDSKFNPNMISYHGFWETETVLDCSYPAKFKTLYKHSGCADPLLMEVNPERSAEYLGEEGTFFSIILEMQVLQRYTKLLQNIVGSKKLKLEKLWDCFHMVNQILIFQNCLNK